MLVARQVDVVVGAAGEEADDDRVERLVGVDRHDPGVLDGQVLEHVLLVRRDVLVDLELVLLPDAVVHDLAADLGLALGPRLLDREEGPVAVGQEVGLVEAGVVLP